MNFWLHYPRLNRQSHSRWIQLIEVKHNMQKTFDNIQKSINQMTPKQQKVLARKLKK